MTVISMSGTEFQTSRVLLAAQSPVFRAMLLTDMKEGRTRTVVLPYPDSVVKKILLLFEGVHFVDPKLGENLDSYLGK